MKFLSLFSGIESASAAWSPLGWKPVAFAEIEKFPCAVLAHHFPHVPNLGDVTEADFEAVGYVDLIVGGSPCQGFSVAGKRLGLDDPRSNLALVFGSIVYRKRPAWFLFENVPGLLSLDDGWDFGTLLAAFSGQPSGSAYAPPDGGWRSAGVVAPANKDSYGLSWRVLDAQYVRVESHPRAVPQRRKRVFVVGYLGDWRPSAAVLLEPEGLRGDTPPRREAGQGPAPSLAARTRGGGGLGTDFDCDGGLVAATLEATASRSRGAGTPIGSLAPVGLNDLGGASHSLTARHSRAGRYDPNGETYVGFSCKDPGADAQQDITPTLRAMAHSKSHANAGGQLAVAHSLTGGGFDASDGTGRGTPIVPVDITNGITGGEVAGTLEHAQYKSNRGQGVIAFDTTQITSKDNRCQPIDGGPCHPLSAHAHAHAPALAFHARQDPDSGEVTHPLDTDGFSIGIQTGWAVRRLTPTECELLMGQEPGYTAIPYRGKQAADGPRYKALGNSKAINCVRWIGARIDLFENLRRAA